MASQPKCFIRMMRFIIVLMPTFYSLGFGQSQWQVHDKIGNASWYYSLAYGNDHFVCVTGNGQIFTSEDGTQWTEHKNPSNQPLYCITYNNGLFVAIGETGTIITSSDGKEWCKQTSQSSATLVTVAHGNGLFITVGSEGTILTSEDGDTWTKQSTDIITFLNGVVYGKDMFVVCGDYLDSTSVILTSTDGSNWTRQESGVHTTMWPITFANGLFIASNNKWYRTSVEGMVLLYSEDGATWLRITGIENFIQDIIYANDQFIAVGENGSIITSPNGIDWYIQESPVNDKWLTGIAFGNNRFVTFTEEGVPLVSAVGEKTGLSSETHYQFLSRKKPAIDMHGSTICISNLLLQQSKTITISCFSILGKNVFSHSLNVNASSIALPVGNLTAGRYIVAIATDTDVTRKTVSVATAGSGERF